MKLIITDDGSHTLSVPGLNEHYHSTFGAITESMHVYIQAGLNARPEKNNLTIFEVGFGTGLNALMTALAVMNGNRKITYYALEKFPVQADMISLLNYPDLLQQTNQTGQLFKDIHDASWNRMVSILPQMEIMKINGSMPEFVPDFRYDLVFFDAFAPEKQPEMWTEDIFRKIFLSMNDGGLLTTYCVKGIVKRMLRQAGFVIEKLPGPPGKREILRALKKGG